VVGIDPVVLGVVMVVGELREFIRIKRAVEGLNN
jgi:hypothetical protein